MIDWEFGIAIQVIDLGEKPPDKVLRQLYVTLQTLKNNRDSFAAEIEKRLRLIVSSIIKLWNCHVSLE